MLPVFLMQTQHHIEAVTIAASNKVTVAGGATAAISGVAAKAGYAVSVADITAIIGVLCAVAGLMVSVYFQWRRDSREQREHKARLRNIKFGIIGEDKKP